MILQIFFFDFRDIHRLNGLICIHIHHGMTMEIFSCCRRAGWLKIKRQTPGGDALTGFEFQRNCALYLLLDNFNSFINKEFFICIEHHDDFLFCYKTDCSSYINEIHAHQAKKLSGKIWTIDSRFSEMVSKILLVGENLRNDAFEKSEDYKHQLTFISNTEIWRVVNPSSSFHDNVPLD